MAVERSVERTATRGDAIVDVRNLRTAFFTDKETIHAVDGVSFDLTPGETVGIVGESGSGKSVTARSLIGLVDSPGRILQGSSIRYRNLQTVREFADRFPGRTVDVASLPEVDAAALLDRPAVDVTATDLGYEDPDDVSAVDFAAAGYAELVDGVDGGDAIFVTEGSPAEPADIEAGFIELSNLEDEAGRAIRGNKIAMVFQDPLTSLNPVYTVGNQIKEALDLHQGLEGQAATREAIRLLEAVGIPDARRRVTEYPHEFSGGMRQRAVIAMALACKPEVLICDEPTTALDVTIQAQILDLLAELQAERDLSIMFITHDMGVIAEVTDRVNVMYAGEVVERADAESLFATPKHPYTQGLLRSIPGQQSGEQLETIPGNVPTPNEPATDCRFAPRCPKAFEECEQVHPSPVGVETGSEDHVAACLLYPEEMSTDEAVRRHVEKDSGGESR
jgi:peptide/nickel transport system ATP-binding protein